MGLHATGGMLVGTTKEAVKKAFIKVNKKQGDYQHGVKIVKIKRVGESIVIRVKVELEGYGKVIIKPLKIKPYQEGELVVGKIPQNVKIIEITNSQDWEFFNYDEWVDMVRYSGAIFGQCYND